MLRSMFVFPHKVLGLQILTQLWSVVVHKNLVGVVYHSEIESMKAAIELKKVLSDKSAKSVAKSLS